MKNETVVLLDFGAQYNQLIARRVRECASIANYCLMIRYWKNKGLPPEKELSLPAAPIMRAEEDAPLPAQSPFELGIPVLGICYGLQSMSQGLGGTIDRTEKREYGAQTITFGRITNFSGTHRWNPMLDEPYQSSGCLTPRVPVHCPYGDLPQCCCYGSKQEILWSPVPSWSGTYSFRAKNVTSLSLSSMRCQRWLGKMDSYAKRTIEELRKKMKGQKVLCALSGGVDSSVAAVLAH